MVKIVCGKMNVTDFLPCISVRNGVTEVCFYDLSTTLRFVTLCNNTFNMHR